MGQMGGERVSNPAGLRGSKGCPGAGWWNEPFLGGRWRRLAKDYEKIIKTGESILQMSFAHIFIARFGNGYFLSGAQGAHLKTSDHPGLQKSVQRTPARWGGGGPERLQLNWFRTPMLFVEISGN
jgi:hypothetical protein